MSSKKYFSYELLKYIKPVWYFHLKVYNKRSIVWNDYHYLSDDIKKMIYYDSNYSNSSLSELDASYQALLRGVVKGKKISLYDRDFKLIPSDIYRFLRKYHKNIWLYITLFQRIVTLYNPVKELLGLWKTRQVKHINLFNKPYFHNDYEGFCSKLIELNPFVSIIIPTYNRYNPLSDLLLDLQNQTYVNFEVIFIDQSKKFNNKIYSKIKFKYKVLRQKNPAVWRARNIGIKEALSRYILFLDDDSRVEPNWIKEHLKCLDFFKADISSGVSMSRVGASIPRNYTYFRWSDQLDTGNVLITKKVFEICGLFDEQFEKMRMGDGEFGIRAYLNGFKNISNPKSSRIHLKSSSGGLREIGYWDAFYPRNIFKIRPVPSVLYLWRKYWGDKSALISCALIIPFSLISYKSKSRIEVKIISLCLFILFFPVIIFQVYLSWRQSTDLLNEGAKISRL